MTIRYDFARNSIKYLTKYLFNDEQEKTISHNHDSDADRGTVATQHIC